MKIGLVNYKSEFKASGKVLGLGFREHCSVQVPHSSAVIKRMLPRLSKPFFGKWYSAREDPTT